jgi:hypothetical protein
MSASLGRPLSRTASSAPQWRNNSIERAMQPRALGCSVDAEAIEQQRHRKPDRAAAHNHDGCAFVVVHEALFVVRAILGSSWSKV